MRKLTFQTFLRRTVGELSFDGQTSPYRLAREVEANPRLLQPLCLYVASVYDTEQRERLFRSFPMLRQEFSTWDFLSLAGEPLEHALESQTPENGYAKLWHSYVSVRDRYIADDHTKLLIHRKVRELQSAKQVSNYRLYTDLRLNPGNVNAWLTHSDCSKVSLETARRTLRYLQQV